MRASERQWANCPYCGQRTSKRHLARHGRLCRLLTERYGSPADMAAAFRADPALKIKHVVAEYPEVGIRFVRSRLLYGGLMPEEMVGRIGHFAQPKPANEQCRRCGVQLRHALVLEIMGDDPPLRRLHEKAAALATPLCGWCATDIARMNVAQRDEDRARWVVLAATRRGRPRGGGESALAIG